MSQNQLASKHLSAIAGHVHNAALAARNGSLGDDEMAERLESIGDAAQTYANYHAENHPRPSDDPVIQRIGERIRGDRARPITKALAGFLLGHTHGSAREAMQRCAGSQEKPAARQAVACACG